ncbi:MAG: lysostaphin resistance A-like protein [Thermoflexales bacterium]
MQTLLFFTPVLAAIWLANRAQQRPELRAFLLTYLTLLSLGGLALGTGTAIAGLVSAISLQGLGAMLAGQEAGNLTLGGAVMSVCAALAMIALTPPAARLAARAIPIDPAQPVHLAALSLTALAFGFNLFQTIALLPAALSAFSSGTAPEIGLTYLDVLAFPLLTLLLSGLLGVGWLTRRNQDETLARLGLRIPTIREVAIAVAASAALIALAAATEALWRVIDPSGLERIGGLSQALLGNMQGLAGAVAIGLAAGLGEEFFFRGAYQPRMGLALTTLLFASFHTQYGLTPATALVVIVSLVLGVMRQRLSLSACIITHFTYNFVLVLLG